MKRVISFVKGGKGREGRGGASDVVPVRNLSLEGGLDEPPGYEVDTKTLSKLQRAAWLGHLDKLKGRAEQLDAPDKGGRAALHLAAAQGHADVVWFLISNRAKVYEPKGLHSHPLPPTAPSLYLLLLWCVRLCVIDSRSFAKTGGSLPKICFLSLGEGTRPANSVWPSRAPIMANEQEILCDFWLAKLRTINLIVASAAVDPIAMFTFYQWRR
jgi:hypothetical protein